ncbi:iron complex transport system substrate-binding protein [Sporobacter termitidis DSM 10068]|uniref:Iron complex transport system substrate-binding protein n=1 Tax=Sporobacter termitidis DSM 10068 TaxID=1123282 RepID=A0A1M5URM1_9FIRM|nr:iron-siderophore ABC transporter substrate-binding protein [Sporobacter termitidis]SHH65707.1 iron complex transport system substrate-binding protein [Sporobacter termitidis DSM 10068]
MTFKKMAGLTLAIALSIILTACAGTTADTSGNDGTANAEVSATPSDASGATPSSEAEYPITIKHAFGETVIKSKPQKIATISWGNQDVPLALGVVPVGVSEANYGVPDGSRLLPWTAEGFKKLGVENPVLFNDTDGLDFEAISDVQPDVILAAYSGMTQDEYNLLSAIAPVVPYPTLAWQTLWRDQIIMDATGMGMKAEGEQLVADLEKLIAEKVSAYPQIAGKSAAFFYFNPSDLGKFYVYLPTDPRAAYLTDLGMKVPDSVLNLAKDSASFAIELSAENADMLKDVDIIIAYGDASLLQSLQADPLTGTIPAVQRGSVALFEDGSSLAAAGTPSALSIPATIDDYLSVIGAAADKAK